MKRFFPMLLASCLLMESAHTAYVQADPRPPLIYGIAERPFPAILQLDYPLCRAEAWISALERAASNLDQTISTRLRQMQLDTLLGRMSVCALLCPLDVVTPERAADKVVRVFLKWPAEQLAAFERINAEPEQILMRMALVWETALAARELRKLWPASLAEASQRMPQLDRLANQLKDLWAASDGKVAKAHPGDSPALLLLAISSGFSPDSNILDKAVNSLMNREVSDPDNSGLWSRLVSRCLYFRGMTQEKENQPALAETDFNAALARLQKSGPLDNLGAELYLARGNLRRHNEIQMCADYMAACALGKCQRLSLARRAGMCGAAKQ